MLQDVHPSLRVALGWAERYFEFNVEPNSPTGPKKSEKNNKTISMYGETFNGRHTTQGQKKPTKRHTEHNSTLSHEWNAGRSSNIKSEMRSFKSNENIHKKEGGSYYVVSANKASSVTL